MAFLVAFLGMALVVGSYWAQEFVAPAAAQAAPEFLDSEELGWLNFGFALTFGLLSLGWLLLGLAALRARIYPRVAAILLIIGAVIAVLPSLHGRCSRDTPGVCEELLPPPEPPAE